jgi:hypothetical protein
MLFVVETEFVPDLGVAWRLACRGYAIVNHLLNLGHSETEDAVRLDANGKRRFGYSARHQSSLRLFDVGITMMA